MSARADGFRKREMCSNKYKKRVQFIRRLRSYTAKRRDVQEIFFSDRLSTRTEILKGNAKTCVDLGDSGSFKDSTANLPDDGCSVKEEVFERSPRSYIKPHPQDVDFQRAVETYICEVCPVKSVSKLNLLRHLCSHIIKQPFPCGVCSESFLSERCLFEHVSIHVKNEHFACVKCDRIFLSKLELQQHVLIHAGRGLYRCGICHKRFAKNCQIRAHMFSHAVLKSDGQEGESSTHVNGCDISSEKGIMESFMCSVCAISFESKKSALSHMLIHSSNVPNACKICAKQFPKYKFVQKHVLVHMQKESSMCKVCSKDFRSRKNLLQHVHVHISKELYVCKVCCKKFTKKQGLLVHMISHTTKTFGKVITSSDGGICATEENVADEKGSIKGGLSVQVSDIFIEKPVTAKEDSEVGSALKNSFVCTVCSHVFEKKEDLSTHVCLCSSGEMPGNHLKECAISPKTEGAQIEIEKELRQSDCATEGCPLSQPSNHISRKMPHVCKFCKRAFAKVEHLATHMVVHTPRKPLLCKICNKTFVRKSRFLKHMSFHRTGESGISDHAEKPSENRCLDTYAEQESISEDHEKSESNFSASAASNDVPKMTEKEQCLSSPAEISDVAGKKHCSKQLSSQVSRELPHECKICARRFSKVAHLAKHMSVHRPKKPLICEICGRTFLRKSLLLMHMLSHRTGASGTGNVHAEKPLENGCLDSYAKQESVSEDHKKLGGHFSMSAVSDETQKINEKEWCLSSQAEISDMAAEKHCLKQLSSQVSRELPHECKICARKFSKVAHLAKHMSVHRPKKLLICKICGKTFVRKGVFWKHMQFHGTGEFDVHAEKPSENMYLDHESVSEDHEKLGNQFSVCAVLNYAKKITGKEWWLSSRAEVSDVAIRKHCLGQLSSQDSTEFPHVCKFCERKFAKVAHLATHMFVHMPKKTLECKICARKFSREGHLARHMVNHASEEFSETVKPSEDHFDIEQVYGSSEHFSMLSNTPEKHSASELKGEILLAAKEVCTEQLTKKEYSANVVSNSGFPMPYLKSFPSYEWKDCAMEQECSGQQYFSDKITYQTNKCGNETKEFSKTQVPLCSDASASERPHECKICCSKFSDMIELSNHVLSHALRETYDCKMCSRKFSTMFDLSSHALTHVSEKWHTCEFCSREFSTELDLSKHVVKHTRDTPHECKICSARFSSMIALSTHVLSGLCQRRDPLQEMSSENKSFELHVH